MRVAVTGTPGTGKTTATSLLAERLDDHEVVHCNELVEHEGLYTHVDEERESLVADLEALEDSLAGYETAVFDSHLAHHLPADRVVVLRCHPDALTERLDERGTRNRSIEENAVSEALDVILAEAVEAHGIDSVYEIDTTDRSPSEVADELLAVVRGDREPRAGTVDFVGYLA